jgi:hypothetical protein
LKVTFDLSDDSPLAERQYQCHSQSVEIFVLSFSTHAAISALAENSASLLGLDRAESRRGGRIEEAHHTGLRKKEAGLESKRGLMAMRRLRRPEAMAVNSEFPDLGFKRLSGYA